LGYMLSASHALDALRYSEEQLCTAQRIAKLGSWEYFIKSREIYYSDECLRIFGLEDQVNGLQLKDFSEKIDADHQVDLEKGMKIALKYGQPFSYQASMSDQEGIKKTLKILIERAGGLNQKDHMLMGTVQDISELKEAEEQIKQLAYYDVLTGLPNRLLFREHVQHSLHIAERDGSAVAVMFLDLDNFKQINDNLGHNVGDELLSQFGERLKLLTRKTDTSTRSSTGSHTVKMSRLGGDEFTILLTGVYDVVDVGRIANRIVKGVSSSFMVHGHEIFITTCLGISLYPADGGDIETLLKHADVAMYHAKSSGRNTYRFYDTTMNSDATYRLKLENNLRKALGNDEFQLYYQPRIEVATGEVVSVEALLRWHHPTMGLIMPDDFIPIAEDTRLIVPIGEWVIEEACRQVVRWQEQGLDPIVVSVNLSAHQFSDEGLKSALQNALESSQCSPEFLEFEITESALMIDQKKSIKLLEHFRETGINIAIDDFGIGYSSLSNLKDFPIDVLKIDRSFISELPQDIRTGAIVSAIINMAQGLNLMVVGEGVETETQLIFLDEHYCDQYQGFYFSKPLPADEVGKILAQSEYSEAPHASLEKNTQD